MILVLNGPNLNLLGKREPAVYGSTDLAQLEDSCRKWGNEFGWKVECRQSNFEGQLIEWLHAAESDGFKGVLLNAGGYTHTSVALRDAISAITLPVLEVHLSNLFAREPFRRVSMLAPACRGSVTGLGIVSYKAGLVAMVELLAGE